MDLFPTILEAAGIERLRDVDGVSIWPTLSGQPQVLRRLVFFVRREGGRGFWGEASYAVIEDQWKLVRNPFGQLELFNLATDPTETLNAAPQEQKIRDRLARALQLHLQTAGACPWQPPAKHEIGTGR
jgi:arylsulfatase A-like enzyme